MVSMEIFLNHTRTAGKSNEIASGRVQVIFNLRIVKVIFMLSWILTSFTLYT